MINNESKNKNYPVHHSSIPVVQSTVYTLPCHAFIYKATSLAEVDLYYTLAYCTVVLIVHLYTWLCLLNAISISSNSHTL